jgi:hypothetical protein
LVVANRGLAARRQVVGGRWVAAALLVTAGCAKAGDPTTLEGLGDASAPRDGAHPIGADGAVAGCGDHVCNPTSESCASCAEDCGACASCAMGSADCDGNPGNGCETNLGSGQSCGGCGHTCDAVGGSNSCVLVGATYTCKPVCDAGHADCDGNPGNGCETDLTTAANCAGCGLRCANPHGSTACSTQGAGYFCAPTCASGWARCGQPADGCTTEVGNDVDHCGDCTRACASTNVAARSCASGVCRPTCNAPFSDCTQPGAPAADNGCETNGTLDPGEPDNTCGGQSFDVAESGSVNRNTSRILPSGDADTYTVNLREGSHTCFPLTSQSYNTKVTLLSSDATLSLGNNLSTCNNTWSASGNTICVNWGGTCGGSDDITIYLHVTGVGGASACSAYSLQVQYCAEGTKCPGC